MTDMMMKIAGRDENGLAKGLSVETDGNNEGVLRVVDAAPFAYDPIEDTQRVSIVRSERKPDRLKATITVGASGNGHPYLNLDVSKYEKISWGVVADSAHAFKLRTHLYDLDDAVSFERSDASAEPYITTTTKKSVLTKSMEIQTTSVYLQIINDATESHTYTVYVYLR